MRQSYYLRQRKIGGTFYVIFIDPHKFLENQKKLLFNQNGERLKN